MKAWLYLEEGADAIIFRDSNTQVVKTISYDSVIGMTYFPAPQAYVGGVETSPYIIINTEGKEHKVWVWEVASPVWTDPYEIFQELYSWVYTDAAPTPAATTAAPTTAAVTTL